MKLVRIVGSGSGKVFLTLVAKTEEGTRIEQRLELDDLPENVRIINMMEIFVDRFFTIANAMPK